MQSPPLHALNWILFSIHLVYFLVFLFLLKEKQMPLLERDCLVFLALFMAPFYVYFRANVVERNRTFLLLGAILISVSLSIPVYRQLEESGLFTIWKKEKSFFDFFLDLQKSNKIKNLSYARTPKGAFILFGTVESKREIDILEKEIKEKNIPCSIRIIVEKLEN